jgi:hypothetical protein
MPYKNVSAQAEFLLPLLEVTATRPPWDDQAFLYAVR